MLRFGMCALLAVKSLVSGGSPEPPPEIPLKDAVRLEQNWTATQRDWFHHTSQGTDTFRVEYPWFSALERPELWLGREPQLLARPEYLARFGFIPSPVSPSNPDGLPIGFARDPDFVDPHTGEPKEALGLTCAGCHTGVLEHDGTRVLVEGGSAMIDLGRFREILGASILYTACVPGRFDRFAKRVLAGNDTPDSRSTLRERFDKVVDLISERGSAERRLEKQSTHEGFGRLDALTRIGNQVFGYELGYQDESVRNTNLASRTAPVKFPHIWDAPWFDWVQYNGSISDPMVRNVGEALGVGAPVNFAPGEGRYASTARVRDIDGLETLLTGLRAPRWPEEILGKPGCSAAKRGERAFEDLCKDCHGSFMSETNGSGARPRKVKRIGIPRVGTDPEQADRMMRRVVLNEFGEEESFGLALGRVVEAVVERAPQKPDRDRPGRVTAEYAYKARPLDGIWASPPYLHNGSVASLWDLLSPEERVASFCRQRFDTDRVGYARPEDCAPEFVVTLDTAAPGNSASGHYFRNGHQRGTVGPELGVEDRKAIIEFLKDPGYAGKCKAGG